MSSSRRVASEKRPAFAAFLTVLLRWPDWDQPLNFIKGYDIVGTVEMSGVFRSADVPAQTHFDEWLGPAAVEAVDRIMKSKPPLFQEDDLAYYPGRASERVLRPHTFPCMDGLQIWGWALAPAGAIPYSAG